MTDKNKQSPKLTLTEAARLASGKDMAPPTIPIKFDGKQSELPPLDHMELAAKSERHGTITYYKAVVEQRERQLLQVQRERDIYKRKAGELRLAFVLSDAVLPAEFRPELPPTKRLHAFIAELKAALAAANEEVKAFEFHAKQCTEARDEFMAQADAANRKAEEAKRLLMQMYETNAGDKRGVWDFLYHRPIQSEQTHED